MIFWKKNVLDPNLIFLEKPEFVLDFLSKPLI
jgi:hypothetical protein